MESRKLFDGVDLHIINTPKFKTNLMSIFFNIPLERNTITKAALLPAVLKRGCSSYPTLRDLSRKLDDMYDSSFSAGVRMKGDGEVLYFTVEYISDKYINENLSVQVAHLLRDIIFSPLTEDNGFLNSYTDSEKINLKNAILGLVNDKKEYSEFKCREAMFGGEGYGMFEAGYVEDLDDITPQNLYEFYLDVLKTSKIDIFLSGDITSDVTNTIQETLSSFFVPRKSTYIESKIADASLGEVKMITEDADVVQSKLCMGLRCGVDPVSDEYNSLMLANCIFGGSPFSKLFNNVREKLSLAYYAVAKTSKFKSVMMISSGIQTENFQAAYDEIMLQLKKMQNGDIEDFEILAAKKYLKNSFNSMNDSLRGMEDYYLSQVIMGTNQSIDALIQDVYSVDKHQICNVMKKVTLDTVYFLKGRLSKEAV